MGDCGIGLITFPSEPSVRGDVYGSVWSLNVKGVTAEVRLPQLHVAGPKTSDQWPASPDVPESEKVSEWLGHGEEYGVHWGRTYQWGAGFDSCEVVGDVKHAVVVIEFPDDVTGKDARLEMKDHAISAAEDWCRRVVAWLSARKAVRVDPGYVGLRIVGQPEYADEMWLHQTADAQSGWDWLYSNEQEIRLQAGSHAPNYMMFASTPDDWTQAARAATASSDIPSEWQLLNSAFVACLDDNFRIAVLDAATALDLALADVARVERIKTHSVAETNAWLDKQTLGQKVQYLENKVALPANMQTEFVDLRNEVAHRNHVAGREETAIALRLAREVLNTYSQFPVL